MFLVNEIDYLFYRELFAGHNDFQEFDDILHPFPAKSSCASGQSLNHTPVFSSTFRVAS